MAVDLLILRPVPCLKGGLDVARCLLVGLYAYNESEMQCDKNATGMEGYENNSYFISPKREQLSVEVSAFR